MIPKLPERAEAVLRALHKAGGRGYLVGGALRDLMLGREPEDWDFASTLTPKELLGALPRARLTGGTCGTVRAELGGGWCEITPCRAEEGYTDARHPDTVRFLPDILADLSRRDFTVNAMAFDGEILIDPFDGQGDLARRLLRCVGKPAVRFREDALRVLRLFRLAAQLGFNAEWATFCAANDAMDTIGGLPRERVADELRRILMGARPQVIAGLIAKGGLAAYGFGFAPSLSALCKTPPGLLYRTWALCALCGADAETVGPALGCSRRFMQGMRECGALYRLGPARSGVELKLKLRRSRLDYGPVAATFAAVSPPFAAEPALYAAVRVAREPYRLRDLAVSGEELYGEGIRGEQCGRVLDELLLAVIKNPKLNSAPVLLGLARGLSQIL